MICLNISCKSALFNFNYLKNIIILLQASGNVEGFSSSWNRSPKLLSLGSSLCQSIGFLQIIFQRLPRMLHSWGFHTFPACFPCMAAFTLDTSYYWAVLTRVEGRGEEGTVGETCWFTCPHKHTDHPWWTHMDTGQPMCCFCLSLSWPRSAPPPTVVCVSLLQTQALSVTCPRARSVYVV